MKTWIKRQFDSSHKRFTAAAIVTGALMFVALIVPLSDRAFYCFLVSFTGFSVLAITTANRKVDQIFADELDPPTDTNDTGETQ